MTARGNGEPSGDPCHLLFEPNIPYTLGPGVDIGLKNNVLKSLKGYLDFFIWSCRVFQFLQNAISSFGSRDILR